MNKYIISSILDSNALNQKDKSSFIAISDALKHGSEFIVLEKEELSGNLEPFLEKAIEHLLTVEKTKMGCRTTDSLDLSSSNLSEWKNSHKKLISMLFYNKKIFNAQFISFYPSTKVIPPLCYDFEYLNQKKVSPQVCPKGNNLGLFIQDANLIDWFCAKHIRLIFENLNIHNSSATQIILFFEKESRKAIELNKTPSLKQFEENIGENETLKKAMSQYNIISIFQHWVANGARAEEKDAYAIIAQYLYSTKNKLWNDFRLNNINPEMIIEKINRGEKIYENSIFEDKSFVYILKKIISAVACNYIDGHFKNTDASISFETFDRNLGKITAYDYIVKSNIPVLFATAKPQDKWSSENLRLNNIEDYTLLSKNLDEGQYSGICLNLYNLILNLVDIEKDINQMYGYSGKYIKEVVIDLINNPGISQTSYRMYSVYSILYRLKQKGMDFAYLSYSISNTLETAHNLRIIRDYLLRNTTPKELPASFYGIDENLNAQHQRTIRENTYRLLDKM
ncbi:MAG: hypothetical protein KAI55_02665 [Candidatus Aenigmarchaeota archaeon]|nr:hypothetical protein [Candidatus Aenigmarchaeota archaeon]